MRDEVLTIVDELIRNIRRADVAEGATAIDPERRAG
jgi:hypothetical protein